MLRLHAEGAEEVATAHVFRVRVAHVSFMAWRQRRTRQQRTQQAFQER